MLLQEDTEHKLGCVSQEFPLAFPRQSQHSLGHTVRVRRHRRKKTNLSENNPYPARIVQHPSLRRNLRKVII